MSDGNSTESRPPACRADSPRARAMWGLFTLSAMLWLHVLGICALAYEAMFAFRVSEDYQIRFQIAERERYNFFFSSSAEGLIGAAQLELLSLLWKVSFFVPWVYFLCRGCQASVYRGAARAAFLCYAGSIGLAVYACISNIGRYGEIPVALLFLGIFLVLFSCAYLGLYRENASLMMADKHEWERKVLPFAGAVCFAYLLMLFLIMTIAASPRRHALYIDMPF